MSRHLLNACLFVSLLLAPAASRAQAAIPELLQARHCIACHQVDQRRVGPPFASIGRRYADAAGAIDYLAGSIRSGSRGRWGANPMPAQTDVTPSEALTIAEWILSLGGTGHDKATAR